MIILYLVLTAISIYLLIQALYVNVIKPEIGEQLRDEAKQRELRRKKAMHDEDGNIICPVCSSKQIQLMKRGWKFTTGFLGSSKVERVCMSCKHKF